MQRLLAIRLVAGTSYSMMTVTVRRGKRSNGSLLTRTGEPRGCRWAAGRGARPDGEQAHAQSGFRPGCRAAVPGNDALARIVATGLLSA